MIADFTVADLILRINNIRSVFFCALVGNWWPDESSKYRTGFLIMPQRPHTWRDQAHGCYTFDNADLGFAPSDLIAHFPVFLHLRAALREWLPGGLVVASNVAVVSLVAAGAVIFGLML